MGRSCTDFKTRLAVGLQRWPGWSVQPVYGKIAVRQKNLLIYIQYVVYSEQECEQVPLLGLVRRRRIDKTIAEIYQQ